MAAYPILSWNKCNCLWHKCVKIFHWWPRFESHGGAALTVAFGGAEPMEEEEMQDLLGDDPGDHALDVSDDEDPMYGEDLD